jgi:hypothetical protein
VSGRLSRKPSRFLTYRAGMDPDSNPPGLPIAPPTAPGQLQVEREPIWPRVLGVIGVVFGVLGLLSGAWGLVLSTILIGPGAPVQAELPERWRSWTVLSSSVSIALAGLLAASAVQLLLRRRRARGALIAWSSLRLVWVFASVAVSFPMFQDQMKSTTAASPSPPPGMVNFMAFFFVALQVVWGSALPVFCLIWLNGPGIRDQVRAWR